MRNLLLPYIASAWVLGLDPTQIKYVVVTHAHGDHYGGVNDFVEKYKARVISSEADWQQMGGGELEFPDKGWMSRPKRDMVGAQGPNPFVIGPEAVVRSLQVMGTCARAQRDRFLVM